MTISALLSPQSIFVDREISSKKKLLEFVADEVAKVTDLPKTDLFCQLLDRERLGSTGLGRGFAVPHARMPELDKTVACFVRLNEGVNFEAPDNQLVDMAFAIVIPEHVTDEHLQILSALASIFSQDAVCEAIRNASSAEQINDIISAAEQ